MLWAHMNDMKLFGSNRYGVMAGNRVNFGSGWRAKGLTFKSSELIILSWPDIDGSLNSVGLPYHHALGPYE